MSPFGKFLRASVTAVLMAVGAGTSLAQQPVETAEPVKTSTGGVAASAVAPLPDISEFLLHNQVGPVGYGRGGTQNCLPACPPNPCYPSPGMPSPGTPSPLGTTTPPPAVDNPDLGGLGLGAGLGTTAGLAGPGGYLDNPMPISTVILRFDAAYGVNRPDRSEFFWASWKELSFHTHAIMNQSGQVVGTYFDPKARGPQFIFQNLNYQEIAPYLEYAFTRRLSAFVDLPTRFTQTTGLLEDPDHGLQPAGPNKGQFFPEPRPPGGENHENLPRNGLKTGGFSDMNAGFKYAVIADPNRYLTFQFRTYIPTGDASLGLGTGHVSLEPGLLAYQRLTDRLVVQAQFRDWIPINGGHSAINGQQFDGNILIYGLGMGYDVYQRERFRITPVGELVGWTCLNGLDSLAAAGFGIPAGVDLPNTHGVQDISGTTIINAKFGVRTTFWDAHSMYVGYGHSLTGARWYRDIFTLQYRFLF